MFVRDGRSRGAQFYLGVMLVGLAFRLIKSFFVFVPQAYPGWGIVAGGVGLWIVGPAFFFYTRQSLNQKGINNWELIHFVPALIILLLGLTRYVYYVGLLHFLIYYGYSIYVTRAQKNVEIRRHFVVFAVCTGLILLCFLVQAAQGGIVVYTIGLVVASGILYVINYFIAREDNLFGSIVQKAKVLDQLLASRIVTDVNQLLSERKIYRNRGLKISELARESNYPVYLISQSINQQHQMRFNEFLNKFRIQEAMERLKNRNENEKIETIAKEVGFSSVTSFYDAFKRETKVTPQAFRNQFNWQ